MYKVQYDARVMDDLVSLSKATRKQIQKAIKEKLITSPELFGKPLRHSLFGFRSLRVGDYRVVYIIENTVVKVFLISHRSIVYKMIEKRV